MSLKNIIKLSNRYAQLVRYASDSEPDIYGSDVGLRADYSPISETVQATVGANTDGVLGPETLKKIKQWKKEHKSAKTGQDLLKEIEESSGLSKREKESEDSFLARVKSDMLKGFNKDEIAAYERTEQEAGRGFKPYPPSGTAQMVSGPKVDMPESSRDGSGSVQPGSGRGRTYYGTKDMPPELIEQIKKEPDLYKNVFPDLFKGSSSLNNILKVASRYERILKKADDETPGYRLPAGYDAQGRYTNPDAYDANGRKKLLDPSSFELSSEQADAAFDDANKFYFAPNAFNINDNQGSASSQRPVLEGPQKARLEQKAPPASLMGGRKSTEIPFRSDVLRAQISLNDLDFGDKPVTTPGQPAGSKYVTRDGKLGPETIAALNRFREKYPQYKHLSPYSKEILDAVYDEAGKLPPAKSE